MACRLWHRINIFKRALYCLLFIRDVIILGPRGKMYTLKKAYARKMIDWLRIYKKRKARLDYIESVPQAPRVIRRNELRLLVQAARRIARWRFMFLLSLRWGRLAEEKG